MNIKKIRIELGLSRKEFAKAIGMSHRTVAAWEQGERGIGFKGETRIQQYLEGLK